MFDEIVRRYRPNGWRVIHRSMASPKALALSIHDGKGKRIICPEIVDRESLFLYLHECGHVHLGHFKLTLETAREEYEAERWAMNTMRQEGIAVPRSVIKDAKDRVRRHIKAAGGETDPHVKRYAK